MMNLLILGGSVFLGRHLVAAAREAGHKVTIFNRGNHSLPEQDDIEQIRGDRQSDLKLLQGRNWDAVVDTCGMEPDVVAASGKALKDGTGHYVFISSISAYDNFRQIGMRESAPTKLIPLDEAQDYGSNKAHCERVVSELYKDSALIIRPGLIVGRYDPSDRFTYWVRRINTGGNILAPGRPERFVQFIDVRDLSEWIIRMTEANLSGTYNATGPGFPLSMEQLLKKCREISKSNTSFTWASDEELSEIGVTPWTELPLWIPETDQEHIGFMQIDCSKAQDRGLSYRTLDETIEDTLSWDKTRGKSEALKAGLTLEKETSLLTQLRNKSLSH